MRFGLVDVHGAHGGLQVSPLNLVYPASSSRNRAVAAMSAARASRRCLASASSPQASIWKVSSSCDSGKGFRRVDAARGKGERDHQRAAGGGRGVEAGQAKIVERGDRLGKAGEGGGSCGCGTIPVVTARRAA